MIGFLAADIDTEALPWCLEQLSTYERLLIGNTPGGEKVFCARNNRERCVAKLSDSTLTTAFWTPMRTSWYGSIYIASVAETKPGQVLREFADDMMGRCEAVIVAVHRRMPSRIYAVWVLGANVPCVILDLDEKIVHSYLTAEPS